MKGGFHLDRPVREEFKVSQWPDRTRRTTPRRQNVIVSVKPDARVWRQAMLLADGDVSRIEVIDATTVIVRNRGR